MSRGPATLLGLKTRLTLQQLETHFSTVKNSEELWQLMDWIESIKHEISPDVMFEIPRLLVAKIKCDVEHEIERGIEDAELSNEDTIDSLEQELDSVKQEVDDLTEELQVAEHNLKLLKTASESLFDIFKEIKFNG